ncbi:hypothetical protein EVAR_83670_1 [Eumeta japonica]|uniref:Uncharacterized protein n=1 Tax=Eumeta variegata TaxID=151549 RepID=A0A4C1UNX5_EUMVA|nr:hypothetical protein EVAR_83670_1 [Eumeta japonica]
MVTITVGSVIWENRRAGWWNAVATVRRPRTSLAAVVECGLHLDAYVLSSGGCETGRIGRIKRGRFLGRRGGRRPTLSFPSYRCADTTGTTMSDDGRVTRARRPR